MRLFYIIAVICLLGACGGKQTKENTDHSALENDKEISLIANPLAIDTASSLSKVVEDTFEFSPQAEVALYSNKFNSRTECDYWIVDLALEKDYDLTVREPYGPSDSTLYAYTPLYRIHITITDKRKKEDNVRNIYITRDMLNNTIGLDSDIIEEFDVTNCLSMTYTKDSVNFRCRLNKTGSDWDIYCGSIIGSDYVKIYNYPYPEEYLSEP